MRRNSGCSGSFSVKNPYLQKLLQEKSKDSDNIWNSILEQGGALLYQGLSIAALGKFVDDSMKAVLGIN